MKTNYSKSCYTYCLYKTKNDIGNKILYRERRKPQVMKKRGIHDTIKATSCFQREEKKQKTIWNDFGLTVRTAIMVAVHFGKVNLVAFTPTSKQVSITRFKLQQTMSRTTEIFATCKIFVLSWLTFFACKRYSGLNRSISVVME